MNTPDSDINPLSHPVLGEGGDDIAVSTVEESRRAALAMAQQAHLNLHIFTRDLDGPIYDQPDFIEAISALARRSDKTFVRVLVQDSQRAVKYGHRLIELSRRLTSHIELRKPSEDYKGYNEAFLVADGRGLIHRNLADRHEGIVNFNAPRQGRDLLKFFDEVWERSEADPELRRLHL